MKGTSSLTCLPSEVLFLILHHLDLYQVILLRQTCTRLADITKDKSVWLSLLHSQRISLPLRTEGDYVDLPADSLEEIVTSNQLVDDLWLVPRDDNSFTQLQRYGGDYLVGLEIFLDRWVLGIYGDGHLSIWDLDSQRCRNYHDGTGEEKCSSHIAQLDEGNRTVTLVLTGVRMPPRPQTAYCYEIHLSDSEPPALKTLYTISLSATRIVRQIDTSNRYLAFSQLCTIELMQYGDDPSQNHKCVVRTGLDSLEEMFTTIHAIQFCQPYLLVLKTRSVEAHPIPSDFQHTPTPYPLPTLRHQFEAYNFREISVAPVEQQHSTSYIVKFFASDVIQGLFFFTARLTIEPDAEPMLDVCLECVYPMAHGVAYRQPSDPTHDHVRSPFFVSAFALGTQAKRAVWIERRRGSMEKRIVACRLATKDRGQHVPELLEGQIIYKFRSYDLNEDLMHCALAEVGGKVVIGNRMGNVFLLDIGG